MLALSPVLLFKWGAYCTQFSSGLGGGQNLPWASHKPEVSRNKAQTRIEHLQDRAATFKGSAGIGEGFGIPGTGLDHHQGMGRTLGCLEGRQVWRTRHHWHGDNITTVVQETEQAGPRSEGTAESGHFDTNFARVDPVLLTDWRNFGKIEGFFESWASSVNGPLLLEILQGQRVWRKGERRDREILRVLFLSPPMLKWIVDKVRRWSSGSCSRSSSLVSEALSNVEYVSPSQGYPQHEICRYPFILLGGKRHCESKVSWPRTQHSVPVQGWNTDCSVV